jgi:protein-disulfide isomerase/uncharacterized membrane protein
MADAVHSREASHKSGLPALPNLLYAIMALCATGIGVSIFLARHKLSILYTKGYISSCNLGGSINCDAVNMSGWSEVKGIPISVLGIPTYAVMIWLTWKALTAMKSTDKATIAAGSMALNGIVGIGVLCSLFSCALIWYSSTQVGAYCLYCVSLYLINFAVTALAVAAGPKSIGAGIKNALNGVMTLAEPLPISLAVFIIAAGVAWGGYDYTKARMEAARLTLEKAELDQAFAGGDAKPAEPATVAANTGSATPPTAQPAAAPTPTPPAGVGVPSGKKTEDGYTFYLTPLDSEDYVYGNPDAKVTVVKYSDFECPYCKYLALTMEPVKAKYKDKVKFVMKHFPMNPQCNRYMAGYDKHPNACNASITGICAGRQGKFWEMHDKLYAAQPKLDPESNRGYASELGLDMAKYDACVKDPSVLQRMNKDIDLAVKAGINGAPRTYINGRLVTGSASTAILEYYIEKSLEHPDAQGAAGGAAPVAMAPKPDGSHMIGGKTATGSFFIDPYEASLTQDGKAVSMPNVEPALASWTEADAACKKAGKRLCTEEEWTASCTGTPPIDENKNNQFADDNVEGNMYPYGSFYEVGLCRDQEDKYKGKAGKTGTMEKCRTPSGIFDLAGNIGEWTGVSKETAGLMGGHNSSGERAACNQRSASFGIGNRNMTTGFRCCADTDVKQGKIDESAIAKSDGEMIGKPIPAFNAKDTSGNAINTKDFKGKVTLINFFASWCGPCKKEFPELVNLYKENKAKGFQIVSIGVDREGGKSLEFAKGFEATWSVIADAESELMGQFNVYSMPATFIIDRQGIVRFMDTGFKPEEQLEKLRSAVKAQL